MELFFQMNLVNIKQIKVNLLFAECAGADITRRLPDFFLVVPISSMPGAHEACTSPGALWGMGWTGIG